MVSVVMPSHGFPQNVWERTGPFLLLKCRRSVNRFLQEPDTPRIKLETYHLNQFLSGRRCSPSGNDVPILVRLNVTCLNGTSKEEKLTTCPSAMDPWLSRATGRCI